MIFHTTTNHKKASGMEGNMKGMLSWAGARGGGVHHFGSIKFE